MKKTVKHLNTPNLLYLNVAVRLFYSETVKTQRQNWSDCLFSRQVKSMKKW